LANNLEVGIQFWPWYDLPTLVEHARMAVGSFPFDQVWMCDEFQYEDTLTVLTVIAKSLDVSLGTMVTFPWRNPLELAQRFSTIAKLLPSGRHVAAGIGAGGAVQEQVVAEKTNPISVVEETVRLLKGLFGSERVPLADFPRLAGRFRYNQATSARLYFPPQTPVPVILAAGGVKTTRLAARIADGIILTQIHPRTSTAAMTIGLFDGALADLEAGKKERTEPNCKMIYNLHLSVSEDGNRARQWAKRNTSYGLASYLAMYPKWLEMAGLDMERVVHVREAYLRGLGVEEAAARVTDEMLEQAGFVIAGTPEECLRKIAAVLPYLLRYRFDQLVIGVPLGPDVPQAIGLIAREILPELLRWLEKGG
jgi:alkanesulfonate monooxygenase SsuD/methylene tetrahydromethanopterin reductase-like flavin-dependent oxidoreductase (luciferase family)